MEIQFRPKLRMDNKLHIKLDLVELQVVVEELERAVEHKKYKYFKTQNNYLKSELDILKPLTVKLGKMLDNYSYSEVEE